MTAGTSAASAEGFAPGLPERVMRKAQLRLLPLLSFAYMIAIIDRITAGNHLVFPIHPRTVKRLESFGLYERLTSNPKLILTEPLDYYAFQKLIRSSRYVITDSGGIQEETTFCRIPCITLRPNTERPSTLTLGTNTLLPLDVEQISATIGEIEGGTYKKGEIPPFWDGKATERIVNYFRKNL